MPARIIGLQWFTRQVARTVVVIVPLLITLMRIAQAQIVTISDESSLSAPVNILSQLPGIAPTIVARFGHVFSFGAP